MTKPSLEPAFKPFSKRQVRDSFNNAAKTYDSAAVLQQEVCKRLLERLDYIKVTPQVIIDIGAGTGQGTRGLKDAYPDAQIIAMDLADKMLLENRQQLQKKNGFLGQLKQCFKASSTHFVCADAEALPFADASVDMIFSSLTIQWCLDLNALFSEFRRVLSPGGLLMFTTLGGQTLYELRQSWSQVSDKIHVNQFVDMHDIGDILYHVQLENPVMDTDTLVLNYSSVKKILLDLKGVGAHNQNLGRANGLMGKTRLSGMYQAYEHFRTEAGFPASYEVLYGHAWNPKTPMQMTQSGSDSSEQETRISLAQLKNNLRVKERS